MTSARHLSNTSRSFANLFDLSNTSHLLRVMGDVAVENPINTPLLHKKPTPSNSIPNIDSLEGIGNDDSDEYSMLKKLQRHLEYAKSESVLMPLLILLRYINLQEEYIKDEQR